MLPETQRTYLSKDFLTEIILWNLKNDQNVGLLRNWVDMFGLFGLRRLGLGRSDSQFGALRQTSYRDSLEALEDIGREVWDLGCRGYGLGLGFRMWGLWFRFGI